jgi:hypothetical protein
MRTEVRLLALGLVALLAAGPAVAGGDGRSAVPGVGGAAEGVGGARDTAPGPDLVATAAPGVGGAVESAGVGGAGTAPAVRATEGVGGAFLTALALMLPDWLLPSLGA